MTLWGKSDFNFLNHTIYKATLSRFQLKLALFPPLIVTIVVKQHNSVAADGGDNRWI